LLQTLLQQKKTKGLKKSKSPEKEEKKNSLRKENNAAVKIQSVARGYLAKILLEKLRKKKNEYNELMDKIQKQAWLDMIQRQRNEDEKQRNKEEEERRRKREEIKLRKIILEAAFDGDLGEIKQQIKKGEDRLRNSSQLTGEFIERCMAMYKTKLIECSDANENTMLSEASAGGNVETIKYLLQNGAHINSQGHYKRTPLYRASFGGHLDAVKVLLEHGGDPRLLDNDGILPEQIAALPEISLLLNEWDVNQTEQILEELNAEEEKRRACEKEFKDIQNEKIQKNLVDAEKEHEAKHRVLQHAHQELAKRIYEHDKCVSEGYDKPEVTLQGIHLAEEELIRAQCEERTYRETLDGIRLQLREETQDSDDNDSKHIKCHLKELDDVLMRDVGDKIKDSKKWPLLIDTSSQAVTFLKYRDTNYINTVNPRDVDAESLRMALLGAIRYGKPLVLDMMEVNMMNFLHDKFDEIQKDLFQQVITKEIIQNNRYFTLLRADDPKEYSKDNFSEDRVEKFKMVLITKMWNIPDEWSNIFYSIKIVITEVV